MKASAAAWVCTPWPLAHLVAATDAGILVQCYGIAQEVHQTALELHYSRKNGNMLCPVTKHRSRLLGKAEKTLPVPGKTRVGCSPVMSGS